jgi:hypothetical protein
VPTPVTVTVEPEIVAGPLVTQYVTAPLEADVALTPNGATPYVCVAIGVKARDPPAATTAKFVVTVAAV